MQAVIGQGTTATKFDVMGDQVCVVRQ